MAQATTSTYKVIYKLGDFTDCPVHVAGQAVCSDGVRPVGLRDVVAAHRFLLDPAVFNVLVPDGFHFPRSSILELTGLETLEEILHNHHHHHHNQ